ncbi:MAG: hypothetical protein QHC90_03970 [Shinella sp.]|nr:hypothetical protein [Shinella sp.]
MLVYGDVEHEKPVCEICAQIESGLEWCAKSPGGRERHERLVGCFIKAAELLQGISDRQFALHQKDDLTAEQALGGTLLCGLAASVTRSWKAGFGGELVLPGGWKAALSELSDSGPVRVRSGEGYAFYALYPEGYMAAAERSGLPAGTIVIGLRSIGTGLAAMVAAALGSRMYTLRPVGHPFDRRVEIGSAMASHMLADKEKDFAIVDEGPGFSGSSFGCVADWLEANGVAPERIHFFPGHCGDLGGQASRTHRERWARRPRHVVEFDDLILKSKSEKHRLEAWISQVVGPLCEPLRDISGGSWRALRYLDDRSWPPANAQMERRKFLARTPDGAWLVKFAGLGETGSAKLRKGRLLSDAGYIPEIAGTVHGFLVGRWIEGVAFDIAACDKRQVAEHVGRYLGFRARKLGTDGAGASPGILFEMAIFNTSKAMGEEAGERVARLLGRAERFCRDIRPIDTDNRLHRWEWLLDANGRLIKTDALDHSSAHDLVGRQDVTWDIAGASVEFDLSRQQRDHLALVVGDETGRRFVPEMLTVHEALYLGFQIGLWSTAGAGTDAERRRIEGLVQGYKDCLSRLLEEDQ